MSVKRTDTSAVRRRGRLAGSGEPSAGSNGPNVEDTKQVLARKVRELRTAQQLSVTRLAQQAEVSAGMISQIERGQATPSIATLVGLANALNVRVADFFEHAAESGRVVRRDARVAIDYPALGVRDELLSADPSGKLEVLYVRIAAGRGSGGEPFVHGSEVECVHVLEGGIVIRLGEERIALGPGDTLTFSGQVPHGFANEGTTDAVMIWIITPVSF